MSDSINYSTNQTLHLPADPVYRGYRHHPWGPGNPKVKKNILPQPISIQHNWVHHGHFYIIFKIKYRQQIEK